MQWEGEAIILTVRRFGEADAIVEAVCRETGIYAGFVRGGSSRRHRGALQPGNTVKARWRARVAENLGTYEMELITARAALVFEDALRLDGLVSLTSLVSLVLPEREAIGDMYDALIAVLDLIIDPDVNDSDWGQAYVRLELGLLDALGYGLDFGCCAATGVADNLAYVSPKSGQAVSEEAAGPWKEKLLPLPAFLLGKGQADDEALSDALRLTGFFLEKRVLHSVHRPLPESRQRLFDVFFERAREKRR